MNSYLPIGSRPGTPRTPLTPRTLQAKTAWWLATASIVLSTLAIFNSGLVHNIQMGGDLHEAQPHIRRIILKSFLLSGDDSRLLYQSK